jgi:hypothetical protein
MSLSVPSNKCQTLLGKALLEHITSVRRVAVVCAASSAIRNSSFGANYLCRFSVDKNSAQLFNAVMMPEECFSLQFTPELSVNFEGDGWNSVAPFLLSLSRTRYLNASVRFLSLGRALGAKSSPTRDELDLFLSNVTRITSCRLEWHKGADPTFVGTDAIFAHFSSFRELTSLEILCDFDGPALARGLSALHASLTSLSMSKRVAKECFDVEQPMLEMRKLDLRNSHLLTDDWLSQLPRAMPQLTCLDLGGTFRFPPHVTDDDMLRSICRLSDLRVLKFGHVRSVSDAAVAELCASLRELRRLEMRGAEALTDVALSSFSSLPHLSFLDISGDSGFSIQGIHSFFVALRSSQVRAIVDLTTGSSDGTRFDDTTRFNSAYRALVGKVRDARSVTDFDWSDPTMTDDVLPVLLELVDDDRCNRIERLSLRDCDYVSDVGVMCVARRFKNLRNLDVKHCKLTPRCLAELKEMLPECEIVR